MGGYPPPSDRESGGNTHFKKPFRNLLFSPFRHPHQVALCAERLSHAGRPHILSIRLQQPSLGVVRQIRSENFIAQPLMQIGLCHWKHHLASFHQVTRHPIRASAVDLLSAAIGKAEDPAVLKKPSHDASHANPPAQTLHPWTQ